MANAPADDESMFQMATRIKARAIRRCGQLLREIKPAKNQHDANGAGGGAPTSRAQAARDAGLSKDQKHQALRVANVSEPEFEAAVEAQKPATVTELADGKKQMPPRSADGRFTRHQAPGYPTGPYHAISCCICDELGPIARTPLAAINPPARSGFRELVIHGVAGWWCRRCLRTRERHLPPASRAECVDAPRPCKRLLCRYHMADSISRKAAEGFRLPETCALDIADKNPDGLTLREAGAYMGMTREGAREVLLVSISKLRRSGVALDLEDFPTDKPEPADFKLAPAAQLPSLKKVGLEVTGGLVAR